MKSYFDKTIHILLIIFIPLIVISIIYMVTHDFFNISQFSNEKDNSLNNINALAFVILTTILLFIAWFQLDAISKTTKADFLFRIEERYASGEIKEARKIIYELTKKENKEDKDTASYVRNEIRKICENKEDIDKFMNLKIFLEFLEFISYCCNNKYISEKDIKEMFGSLHNRFDIFKGWIEYKREEYDNPKLYSEFKTLSEKLRPKEKNKTCKA